MHWIGAHCGICSSVEFRDEYSNKSQNLGELHVQSFLGLCVQKTVV